MLFWCSLVGLTLEVHAGGRELLLFPRLWLKCLVLGRDPRLKLIVEGGRIALEHIPDAITLSIRGKKVARVYLDELEAESAEQQKRYASKV